MPPSLENPKKIGALSGHVVALAGGGTGGHVYPALAMGSALVERGAELIYYGDAGRLEGRVVPARGITFHPVAAAQFPRAGLVGKLRFALALLRSILACRGQIKRHKPSLVLGVGGYISAPTVLAAWTLGIPTAIHESNAMPGLANRLCALVAKVVLLTFEAAGRRLPGDAPRHVVGCPVSPTMVQGDAAAARARHGLSADRPVLLVVGGSLGAQTINDLGIALARAERGFQVALITGPRYHEATSAALQPLPPDVAIIAYEDRMADAYAAADLVLCRAGAATLAELTALGKPSVLVPSPNVTDNHQEVNARDLESIGAARVVVEADLEIAVEVDTICALMADSERLARMGSAARSLGTLDTADQVAELLIPLIRGD
jgi:UDP-N-acetylglucosamine--N-acetylmuramyl-(pentapeptide) pyrophosphoryl-undecaprenol N-acetylglucosamine transferase